MNLSVSKVFFFYYYTKEKMTMDARAKFYCASWDYLEHPYDDLREILSHFGVYMYPDPAYEGTNTFGFIFSNRVLKPSDLKEISDTLTN